MRTKVIVSVENGIVRAVANGSIELYVEDMDNLNGIEQVQASEIPDKDFQALIDGRIH